MALINCPDCKNKISQSATSCPNCGFTSLKIRFRRGLIAIIAGAWAVTVYFGSGAPTEALTLGVAYSALLLLMFTF